MLQEEDIAIELKSQQYVCKYYMRDRCKFRRGRATCTEL